MSQVTSSATRSSRTRSVHIVVSAVLLVLFAILFLPTWQALVSRWISLGETDGHGFLVLATFLYLVFYTAAKQPPVGSVGQEKLPVLMLLFLSLLWQLANMSNVLLIQAIAVPLIILTAFVSVLGFRQSAGYIFPVFFLYFAMPVWGVLNPVLQKMSVSAVSWILAVVDIPAFIEGEMVHLPSGSFHIASGCSGLHFFIIGIALAALCGHMFLTGIRHKVFLLLVAGILAIVSNWVRIAAIVVIGYTSEMQHDLVVGDHYFFGWIIFVMAMIPLYFVVLKLEKIEISKGKRNGSIGIREKATNQWRRRLLVVSGAACLFPLIGFTMDWVSLANRTGEIPVQTVLGSWVWLDGGSPDWNPEYAGVSSEIRGQYRRQDAEIDIYSNVYVVQKNGEELVGQASGVLRPPAVLVERPRDFEYVDSEGATQKVIRVVGIEPNQSRQIVNFWYVVGDRRFTSPTQVKLHELIARLRGKAGSGVVALMMQCESDCQTEQSTLAEFLAEYDDVLGSFSVRDLSGQGEKIGV